jgi:L-iditol 2-dehydrogenase
MTASTSHDRTMRQAVIVTSGSFAVRTTPRASLRAADEILVRTAVCGICSGDLMPWYLARKIGTVLGHEVVGWAAEVGSAVGHVRPGDLVFMHHHAPCGACEDCARDAPVHCAVWRRSGLDPGGMAEWVRVPGDNVRGDSFAVNDLTPEQALFIEPLGCCVKALRRAGGLARLDGARVAVIGCGVMGLLNLAAAREYGAGQLVAVEPDPDRRRAARDFDAEQALTPDEAAPLLAGRMDVVIVGPGSPETIRQALVYVRNAGVAVLFTPTPAGVTTTLDLGDLYFRDVSLVPSYSCGPSDTREAYKLLRSGRVKPEAMITHRFPLEAVQAAYDTARSGGAALKVLVTFATENER